MHADCQRPPPSVLPSSCFIPASPDRPSFLPTHTEYMFLYLEVKHEGTQSLGLLAVEKILEEGEKKKIYSAGAGRGKRGKPELRAQLAPY